MVPAELFNDADIEQLDRRGISIAEATRQIMLLRTPPPAVRLDRAATVGDGIRRLTDAEAAAYAENGLRAARAGRVSKFVPASGAATRMFHDLAVALEQRDWYGAAVERFVMNLDRFAFAAQLIGDARSSGIDLELSSPSSRREMLALVLSQFGSLPKGLLPFHCVADQVRTPLHEHAYEAVAYARDAAGRCRAHFTVSRAHQSAFEQACVELCASYRAEGVELDVSFSDQSRSTDTLAVDLDGAPFRAVDGSLLFRPGGHGALIANLSALQGDIVSIKNIDNVVPPHRAADTIRWKAILIGVAASLHDMVIRILRKEKPDDADIAWIESTFARKAYDVASESAREEFVRDALKRPLRVCGVVSNSGEPGGAPFWVRAQDAVSLQIVEASQIDRGDAEQDEIWRSSTHFNPVDIVCVLRDDTGAQYDLARFIDHDAAFIAMKSHEGRGLRALERPGLWNGAMAGWNTLCVEVPSTTFAPVKTVFDLLRPEHQ